MSNHEAGGWVPGVPTKVREDSAFWDALRLSESEATRVAWATASWLTRSHGATEDLFQASFVELTAQYSRGALNVRPGKGTSYLRRVVRNTNNTNYRYRTREKRGGPDAPAPSEFNEHFHGDGVNGDPADIAIRQIEKQDLQDAINCLAPQHREIMNMVYEEYSIAEISRALGAPPSTIRSRLKAAQKTMREAMAHVRREE